MTRTIGCVLAAAMLAGVVRIDASAAPGVPTASTGADSAITVSIAVPLDDYGNRNLFSGRFYVVITNASDKPQKIWSEACSMGYDSLSFEITDEFGKTWVARKKPRGWDKNFPISWTLLPKETLVLDVHFADSKIWEGFPSPSGTSQAVTMRAIFEIGPGKNMSRQIPVWTGRAVSKADKFVIHRL